MTTTAELFDEARKVLLDEVAPTYTATDPYAWPIARDYPVISAIACGEDVHPLDLDRYIDDLNAAVFYEDAEAKRQRRPGFKRPAAAQRADALRKVAELLTIRNAQEA